MVSCSTTSYFFKDDTRLQVGDKNIIEYHPYSDLPVHINTEIPYLLACCFAMFCCCMFVGPQNRKTIRPQAAIAEEKIRRVGALRERGLTRSWKQS